MTATRILLLEDNPADLRLIKKGIRKGVEKPVIIEAKSEESFDSTIASGNFDIVVTDFDLGWINGLHVLKTVKTFWPKCPVIMMTVIDNEDVAVDALQAGLDHYIMKSSSQFALIGDTIRTTLEQKETTQALEEAETRYQELSESVPIGLFRILADGTLVNVNQTLVSMLNYPDRETLLAVNSKELYADLDIRRQHVDSLRNRDDLQTWEISLKKYGSGVVSTLVTTQVFRDENQVILYVEGYIRDISEQKRVEEALSQSRMLNETIIASVQDGVLVTDRNLRIVVWNSYLESLSGLMQDEVSGDPAFEILTQATKTDMEVAFRQALQGETVFSSDMSYYFPGSGRQGWFEITYAPLRHTDGNVIGVVANIHDITQRKKYERELDRLLQIEQKRSRELTALTTAARTISSNLEIDQVLNVVARQMIRLLNIDCCSLSTWNEGQDHITMLVEYKVGQSLPEVQKHTVIDISKQDEKKSVLVNKQLFLSTIDDPKLPASLKQTLANKNIQSLMMIPMIYQNRTIGLIELEDHQTQRTFDSQEIFLAQMLGNQAAVALENGRLFNETAENLRRETTLHEITRLTNNSMDVDTIIDTTNRLITDLFGGNMAALMVVNQKNKEIKNIKYYNAPPNAPLIQSGERGLMMEALVSKQPILLSDYQTYELAHPYWLDYGLTACMVVPLESTEIFLGVVGVFSTRPEKKFTTRDLEMAVSIGSQVSTALHKALLYEQTVRRSQELGALYDIALTSSSFMDTPKLLHYLHTKMQELITPDYSTVYLFDEETQTVEAFMAYNRNHLISGIQGKYYSLKDNRFFHQLITRNKSINYGDLQSLPEPLDYPHLHPETNSILAVLLSNGERVLGVLCVQSNLANHFSHDDQRLLESIVAQVSIALDNARLYEELEEAYVQTVLALANAVDVRDTYTNDHSQRIAVLAHETGLEMGMDTKELNILHWGSLLHDIGKIGVPDDILLKPGKLTEEEYEAIKKHPELGSAIVAPVKKLEAVAPIIRAHQEHFNGSGYPDGLAGEQIPLAARILTVVDSYIAMTDDRVYRKALSHEAALQELNNYCGTQFDPEVVAAFLRVLENRKKGREKDPQKISMASPKE